MEWLNWAFERAGGTPWGNGRPRNVHLTLLKKDLKPGRVIIVGDIHGCYEELQALLKTCNYNQAEDNLILAGDLINKGPASLKVLKAARDLGALCIRGNHEDGILALLRARKLVASVSSSYSWVANLKEVDKEYLRSLPFTIRLPDYRVGIVHAGLLPDMPWEKQSLENMLFLEDLELNEYVTSQDPEKRFKRSYNLSGKSWAHYWKGPLHVFFGHAADRGLQQHRCATGLDTGCVQGGRLTAAILPPYSQLKDFDKFKAMGPSTVPTLDQLNAQLVGVAAQSTYKQPKNLQPRSIVNLPLTRSANLPSNGVKPETPKRVATLSRSNSAPQIVR